MADKQDKKVVNMPQGTGQRPSNKPVSGQPQPATDIMGVSTKGLPPEVTDQLRQADLRARQKAFAQAQAIQELQRRNQLNPLPEGVDTQEGVSISNSSTPDREQERQPEPIGKQQIKDALSTLTAYKAAKSILDQRIISEENWYQLRHWEEMRKTRTDSNAAKYDTDGVTVLKEADPEPTSAWLFDAIANKHADINDNYPEPNVLPREEADEQDAELLSKVLPTILEANNFEGVYDLAAWYKLKHGGSIFGTFWDGTKLNGLGDISIQMVDVLNVFWQPDITDIQDSKNVFIVSWVDTEILNDTYPALENKYKGDAIQELRYVTSAQIPSEKKTMVVDWYYKRRVNGRTLLHMCKFAGEEVLFSSENDPEMQKTGWYNDGKYPISFDILFPEAGTPYGFGLIAIAKDPQLYIDKLDGNILLNAITGTKPRYFASKSAAINMQDFVDQSIPIVRVEGDISDIKIRPFEHYQLDPIYVNVRDAKVNEMKETTANRDFSSGSTQGGVTAASAIAALQEAGNKRSRDMISTSYLVYKQIVYTVIERIRQFYDEPRIFRIRGEGGKNKYVPLDNSNLKGKPMESVAGAAPESRVPVFDITIRAQKRNPFSKAAQNELAKEFYGMGFFDPMRAQQAMIALEMMEFEGKEKVLDQVMQGQTLMNIIQQMQMEMQKMAALLQLTTGQDLLSGEQQNPATGQNSAGKSQSGGQNSRNAQAQTEKPGYTEQLLSNSKPDMNKV